MGAAITRPVIFDPTDPMGPKEWFTVYPVWHKHEDFYRLSITSTEGIVVAKMLHVTGEDLEIMDNLGEVVFTSIRAYVESYNPP